MTSFTESVVEQAALVWLESVGWQVRNGAEIAPANLRRSATITGRSSWRSGCAMLWRGSGAPRPPMESVQALLAAEAADTIVGFLHRVHRQDRTPSPSPRALYTNNLAFNDSMDETHGMIRIFEVEFRPSEVLFQMEPESYRVYLAEFDEEADGAESGMTADGEAGVSA